MDDANAKSAEQNLREIFRDAYNYIRAWLDPTALGKPLIQAAHEMNDIAKHYEASPLADFAAQLMVDCFHTIGRAHGNIAAGRRKDDE